MISKLKTIISVFPGQVVHVLIIHRCVSYHSMSVHLPDINNLQLGVARLSRAKVFLNDLIFITATINQWKICLQEFIVQIERVWHLTASLLCNGNNMRGRGVKFKDFLLPLSVSFPCLFQCPGLSQCHQAPEMKQVVHVQFKKTNHPLSISLSLTPPILLPSLLPYL